MGDTGNKGKLFLTDDKREASTRPARCPVPGKGLSQLR